MTGGTFVGARTPPALSRWAARVWSGTVTYAIKFGIVGAIGMVVDVGVFNALRAGALGTALMNKPLTASLVSVSLAIVFNWLGNRYWTFRHNRRRNALREFAEYAGVSLIGLVVALACLAVSHYGLGLTTVADDNISKNVIGLVLGTAVRFAMFRYWVWGKHRHSGVAPSVNEAVAVVFDPSEENS